MYKNISKIKMTISYEYVARVLLIFMSHVLVLYYCLIRDMLLAIICTGAPVNINTLIFNIRSPHHNFYMDFSEKKTAEAL